MTESQILSDIRLAIGSRPDARLFRSNAIKVRAPNGAWVQSLPVGWPDLTGVLQGGRMLVVECKKPGGALSDEQVRFGEMFTRFGALWVCATTVEEVEDAIARRKICETCGL